jgi:DNA polymerase-3 subunit delta
MPLFVYTGPEAGEKKTAIESVKTALKKTAGAIDEFVFYASETEVGDVVKLLLNESLFASARFVILRDAELIKKKEDIEAIKSWTLRTERAKGLSTLILESSENGIGKQLENLAPKENCRVFWEMFENKKEEWLRKFFAKAGYGIDDDAIDTILGMVENDTESLAVECSRFFLCFDKEHAITSDDAESLLAHNREESAFTLFEALVRAELSPRERLENALSILQRMRASKENSPQKIFAGLFYCFRKIADWREFCAAHPSPSQFDYKVAGFSARKAQTQYRNAARLWTGAQTADCLALLASSEADTREGIPSEAHDSLLQTMLYALCVKHGSPLEKLTWAW